MVPGTFCLDKLGSLCRKIGKTSMKSMAKGQTAEIKHPKAPVLQQIVVIKVPANNMKRKTISETL